jgi:hypothetical protein
MYVILTRGGVIKSMWREGHDMDLLVAILAAVIHDFEHKGVNVSHDKHCNINVIKKM